MTVNHGVVGSSPTRDVWTYLNIILNSMINGNKKRKIQRKNKDKRYAKTNGESRNNDYGSGREIS